MITRHNRRESSERDRYGSTIDETKDTPIYCLADDGDGEYQSCGRKMRRRRDETTHCPIHGEMH